MLLAACAAPIGKLSSENGVPCPSSMHSIEERVASDLHPLALPLTKYDKHIHIQQIYFPALTGMLAKCVQLRSFNHYNAEHMSDDDLATLVIPSKHMNELRIYRAPHISDGAMMAFLAQLRDTGAQLEGLNLLACEMLTDATLLRHIAMLFPRIKRVDMRWTGVTDDLLIDIFT